MSKSRDTERRCAKNEWRVMPFCQPALSRQRGPQTGVELMMDWPWRQRTLAARG